MLFRDANRSPDIFIPMVDRLAEFVVPYQQAMETDAAQRNMHLYLQGLLSHLPGKNAEDIATFLDVERQVMQAFIGTAPWEHRPLIEVLVPQVACRLGQPDGIIAFDPSSVPKRGTHSVGVKRQWCGHRSKVDNRQVSAFMGYVGKDDHALLDFRLSLPTYLAGLASPHGVVADGVVVLDRRDPPGSAVDASVDPAASALRAEPALAGDLLHAERRLYLPPSAATITAQ